MDTLPEATRIFEAQRPRLLRLAYRMLSSVSEAQDVVQDAWLRWRRVDLSEVQNAPAFLSRIVTRLCLDAMKSARVRRETYIGSWLPDPLPEPDDDLRADNLTLTLMLALERLSPLERAAFLLHDVFDTPMDEIALILERDVVAVRQLASRARRNVQSDTPRYPVARDEGERIATAFLDATRTGNIGGLQTLLAEGVRIVSDGGGKVLAFPNAIAGIDKALRLYRGLFRKYGDVEILVRTVWIDGLPGYISLYNGTLQTTSFQIEDGRILGVYKTRNPDKLAHISAGSRVGH
ncbi:MAG: sigma-70 family RNA polymerase sigma factor [Alphaproteobacteria bacterium]|nr:sigma-70 family RNA polymerase sigma factor [Alphaproteobacteria bacterium]MBU1551342.1 sigma-70 family RNA polymerase sigma factor [Alphaproteobacteria bacterium]MBU2336559.1 sigma-70 family RNA polymerase sigma factor [Alphaproteobacteria bacterium]MBU2387973.1 sigma-70 family RNA polymerase sigma factor [Alphaproteobacteria bacterium]